MASRPGGGLRLRPGEAAGSDGSDAGTAKPVAVLPPHSILVERRMRSTPRTTAIWDRRRESSDRHAASSLSRSSLPARPEAFERHRPPC
jgi:hypothetical protein